MIIGIEVCLLTVPCVALLCCNNSIQLLFHARRKETKTALQLMYYSLRPASRQAGLREILLRFIFNFPYQSMLWFHL